MTDTSPESFGDGRGLELTTDELMMRGSAITGNHDVGVGLYGAQATIERSLIADTGPAPDGTSGHGLQAVDGAVVSLRQGALLRNHETGCSAAGFDTWLGWTRCRRGDPTARVGRRPRLGGDRT